MISQVEVVETSMHLEIIVESLAEEKFINSYYDLTSGDEDYQHVINEQKAKKKMAQTS